MQIRLASDISYDSIVDGPGLRMVIWTQGCPHNCSECHNPQTHDFTKGALVDIDLIVEEIVKYPMKSGVTISGGEPFAQSIALLELLKKLKDHNINIWSFSGYTYEEIIADKNMKECLNYLDVLIDGKYIKELKTDTLVFRGSSNQRIINVQETLKTGNIVLMEY